MLSLLLLRRLSPKTRLPLSASYSSPSLSARMTFVFDQIDALEKERSEKDETAHRIRAWRDSKKAHTPEPDSELSTVSDSVKSPVQVVDEAKHVLEFVHPWPEWVELMEMLVQQNYLDRRRIDEDKVVGFHKDTAHDASAPAFKNFRLAHDSFIKLGKERFDIFRSVAGQDIQTLVGFGCPISDKKVVFASKLLRKHVHLDEGDVCSSCSLRNTCPSAFLISKREDEARCVDMMRVLFTYGFDPHNRARINPSVMKQKSVKTVVRKLLHRIVRLISVPIDPSLPPPIIKKRIPKVKQPPPPPRRRVGRDDVEMKKGDWICPKCDFMNFSKNTVCLQCDAKPPKRQLLPGEWECPQCNFLNYRRNVVCFHCDCKRPPDEFTESKMQESQQGPGMRAGSMAYRPEGVKAWNFDFDDDESDGADVAAFEYADSSAMEKGPFDQQGGMSGRPEPDLNRASRDARGFDEEYSDDDTGRPSNGFNDFADEEDDVDSYEIDDGISSPVKTRVSSDDFPKFESEAVAGSDNNFHGRGARSNPIRGTAFSGSDDFDSESDSDVSARPNLHRAPNSQSYNKQSQIIPKRRAFSGSDDDELDNVDDAPSRNFGSKQSGRGNDFNRRGSPRMMRGSSGSEDEDEDLPRSYGNRSRGSAGPRRGAGNSRGRGNFESQRDGRSGHGGRRNSYVDDDSEDENFGGSSRGSRGRGSRGKSDGPRMNDRNSGSGGRRNSFANDDRDFGGSSQGFRGRGSRGKSGWSRMNDGNSRTRSSGFRKCDFDESRGGGSGKQRGGRRGGGSHGRDYSEDVGSAEYKNSRRVINR